MADMKLGIICTKSIVSTEMMMTKVKNIEMIRLKPVFLTFLKIMFSKKETIGLQRYAIINHIKIGAITEKKLSSAPINVPLIMPNTIQTVTMAERHATSIVVKAFLFSESQLFITRPPLAPKNRIIFYNNIL